MQTAQDMETERQTDLDHLVSLRDSCIGMLERRRLEYSSYDDLRGRLAHTITFWRYTEARAQFAQSNMGFVNVIVNRYFSHFVSVFGIEDLMHEGLMGLLRAIDLYQPGVSKFTTYSAHWIRHFAQRGIQNKMRIVRIPVHQLDRMAKIKKAEDTTEHDEQFLAKMKARMQVVGEDHLRSKTEMHLDYRFDLMKFLERLPPRVYSVMEARFGLDGGGFRTLQEIGDEMGLTKERVRQIESDGIRRLKEMYGIHSEFQ